MTPATLPARAPGFYLKCGAHFMSIHVHATGYVKMNACDPKFARFDTELEALQVRDAAIAKVWRCPRLVVVEVDECEACEAVGPVVQKGHRILCEKCAEPDENGCESCRFEDGTHYELGRWICDSCTASPDDVQPED